MVYVKSTYQNKKQIDNNLFFLYKKVTTLSLGRIMPSDRFLKLSINKKEAVHQAIINEMKKHL